MHGRPRDYLHESLLVEDESNEDAPLLALGSGSLSMELYCALRIGLQWFRVGARCTARLADEYGKFTAIESLPCFFTPCSGLQSGSTSYLCTLTLPANEH